MAGIAGTSVRQLVRDFWKVDLEVVNKDVVHCLLSWDFKLSKSG
jgi:hypothetical protein